MSPAEIVEAVLKLAPGTNKVVIYSAINRLLKRGDIEKDELPGGREYFIPESVDSEDEGGGEQ